MALGLTGSLLTSSFSSSLGTLGVTSLGSSLDTGCCLPLNLLRGTLLFEGLKRFLFLTGEEKVAGLSVASVDVLGCSLSTDFSLLEARDSLLDVKKGLRCLLLNLCRVDNVVVVVVVVVVTVVVAGVVVVVVATVVVITGVVVIGLKGAKVARLGSKSLMTGCLFGWLRGASG